ncbi:MAG: peptidyl-prolyl cis-trans isomerase [Lentisphaeria bacterium]|nr:peptidyl-prolyl cis-trans isomerase [Lentisphaeria bacterium]
MKKILHIPVQLLFAGILLAGNGSANVKIDGLPIAQQNFSTKAELNAAVYEELLFRFFTAAGVPPNEKDTAAFLEKINAVLPSGMRKHSQAELHAAAKQRSNQISTAARKFFSARIPELEMVEAGEIEKLYQSERKRFTKPGNLQCAAMVFNDRTSAEKARAELLQGGNFDRIRQTYQAMPPKGTGNEFLPLLRQTHPRLYPAMVSDILQGEKHFFVVQIRQFTPAAVIPLADVSACLKEEIIAKRTAELLAHLLKAELPKHKIEIPETVKGKVEL